MQQLLAHGPDVEEQRVIAFEVRLDTVLTLNCCVCRDND